MQLCSPKATTSSVTTASFLHDSWQCMPKGNVSRSPFRRSFNEPQWLWRVCTVQVAVIGNRGAGKSALIRAASADNDGAHEAKFVVHMRIQKTALQLTVSSVESATRSETECSSTSWQGPLLHICLGSNSRRPRHVSTIPSLWWLTLWKCRPMPGPVVTLRVPASQFPQGSVLHSSTILWCGSKLRGPTKSAAAHCIPYRLRGGSAACIALVVNIQDLGASLHTAAMGCRLTTGCERPCCRRPKHFIRKRFQRPQSGCCQDMCNRLAALGAPPPMSWATTVSLCALLPVMS